MQRLRNYLLHYRIPPFGLSMQFAGSHNLSVYIDRDVALEYSDWTTAARSYLERQPEQIVLGDLIESSAPALKALYDWFFAQAGNLHVYKK